MQRVFYAALTHENAVVVVDTQASADEFNQILQDHRMIDQINERLAPLRYAAEAAKRSIVFLPRPGSVRPKPKLNPATPKAGCHFGPSLLPLFQE